MIVQFILHETEGSKHDINLYVKGMRIVNLLTQWTKSLSKAIAVQRQKHGIKMTKIVATTSDAYEFLENSEVKAKLNTATHNLTMDDEVDINDVKLITAYAAAVIVYKNSQRSGVVKNLTNEEFNMRRVVDKEYVIHCTNH